MVSLALLEVDNLTPALLVADRCAKAAGVEIVGIESADGPPQCIKLSGDVAAVQAAGEQGAALARQMGSRASLTVLPGPTDATRDLASQPPAFIPLLGIYDARTPNVCTADAHPATTGSRAIAEKPPTNQILGRATVKQREPHMKNHDALGLLETQGLVAALHATDDMLKAANVQLVGKEKIGAAYVTILVRGDVAAVQAAVDAGRATVERLGGKLILADIIPRPHPELAALLPGS